MTIVSVAVENAVGLETSMKGKSQVMRRMNRKRKEKELEWEGMRDSRRR